MQLNVQAITGHLIGLMLVFLCILPITAQPTSLRDFRGSRQLIQNRIEAIAKINNQIEKDKLNVSLYKKRLFLNAELLILTDGTNDWNIYAEEYQKDLSRLVELERTPGSYSKRARSLLWLFVYRTKGIYLQPFESLSELYPHNHYVDAVASDLLKLIKLNPAPENVINIYIDFSTLYTTRPEALVLAPNFPKWKDKIPIKLVQKDFEESIKYSLLAYKLGANIPSRSKFVREHLASTYLRNAEIAAKLGDQTTALKFTQAAQKLP